MFELPCASVSKRVLVQNLSYENEFDLNDKKTCRETRFETEAKACSVVSPQSSRPYCAFKFALTGKPSFDPKRKDRQSIV